MSFRGATKEHIIPKSFSRNSGGTDDFENIALSHKECNRLRSSNVNQPPHSSFLFYFVRDRLELFKETLK